MSIKDDVCKSASVDFECNISEEEMREERGMQWLMDNGFVQPYPNCEFVTRKIKGRHLEGWKLRVYLPQNHSGVWKSTLESIDNEDHPRTVYAWGGSLNSPQEAIKHTLETMECVVRDIESLVSGDECPLDLWEMPLTQGRKVLTFYEQCPHCRRRPEVVFEDVEHGATLIRCPECKWGVAFQRNDETTEWDAAVRWNHFVANELLTMGKTKE